MEFQFKPSHTGIIANLTILSGTAAITEDVSVKKPDGTWGTDQNIMRDLLELIVSMKRHDMVNDVDFVKEVYDILLTPEEKEKFLEKALKTANG